MTSKTAFLKKYGINNSQFEECGLVWKDLTSIYNHYNSTKHQFTSAVNPIVMSLNSIPECHAINSRIKDPYHLIEKIIRLSIKEKSPYTTLGTYTKEVKDLIGVRIIHKFKDEWENIHNRIVSEFDLIELPKAYVSKFDPQGLINGYQLKGLQIEEKRPEYRSLHYNVNVPVNRTNYYAEIQVRTLFEEAWGEIDHKIRYPYEEDDIDLTGLFSAAASVAGLADALGSVAKLKKEAIELGRVKTITAQKRRLQVVKKLEAATENLRPLIEDVSRKLKTAK